MAKKKQDVTKCPIHRIAIIQSQDLWSYDYEEHSKIISKITDFSEVDHETYENLRQASIRFGFIVIEQPIDQESFIKETVADWLKFVEAEQKRQAEEKAKNEAKRRERLAKAEAKRKQKEQADTESQRALFEELKKKFGNETTS